MSQTVGEWKKLNPRKRGCWTAPPRRRVRRGLATAWPEPQTDKFTLLERGTPAWGDELLPPVSPEEIGHTEAAVIPEENKAAIELLNSWLNEDVEEQKETWVRLESALEENRSSNRKLFS